MRRIKFRVWDKSLKQMNIVGTDMFDSLNLDDDCNVYYENISEYTSSDHKSSIPKNVEYVLMQSTGLLDRNGEEIFEGDIVNIRVGIYANFLNIVEWNENNASYILKPVDTEWSKSYFVNYEDKSRFEIVGNIFESPELLEAKK